MCKKGEGGWSKDSQNSFHVVCTLPQHQKMSQGSGKEGVWGNWKKEEIFLTWFKETGRKANKNSIMSPICKDFWGRSVRLQRLLYLLFAK